MASQKQPGAAFNIWRLHRNDLQVLQLIVLLDQEQGRHHHATAELTTRFKSLEPGQRYRLVCFWQIFCCGADPIRPR